ncbi:MAG: uroporphyrinogen-III synthase [Bacteroidota bacterium]
MGTTEANLLKGFKILIAQPETLGLRTTYHKLTEHYGVQVDFRMFTKVAFITATEFRHKLEKLNNVNKKRKYDYTAIIFRNQTAIDCFFSLGKEANISFPPMIKYFFFTEALKSYIKKYIRVEKQKLLYSPKKTEELSKILKRHKKERFLIPCSDIGKKKTQEFFKKEMGTFCEYKTLIIYANEPCALQTLVPSSYNIIVFFSPFAVKAFVTNFPKQKFTNTKIASFGQKTLNALRRAGLKPEIIAPSSMLNELYEYIGKLKDAS